MQCIILVVIGGSISRFIFAKHFEAIGWKAPLLLLLILAISWLSLNSPSYGMADTWGGFELRVKTTTEQTCTRGAEE